MADSLKLYGVHGSPFVCKVKIALNIKGIKYEFVEEDLSNKSTDLLKYNPVYKKVPVLVHNGKPLSESLVIVEYIDEVWNKQGSPILPEDAYEKYQARFWAKFVGDKCLPAIFKAIGSLGQEQAVAEAQEQLQFLENELNTKGTKFFGGDSINLVDISASFIAYWLVAVNEALGIKIVTEDKFPKLSEWSDNYVNYENVKAALPPKANLVAFFKKRFGKA